MIQQRKPAKRLFTGMAGSPLSKIEDNPAQSSEPAPVLAETQIQNLMDRVVAANTDQEVKLAVRETLSPEPKKRGRPRVYDPATLKQRDRERKRRQRLIANHKIATYLRHWELGPDSKIPPGLKTKYGITVDSFRELLADDKIEAKVLKEIGRDLKMIGAIPSPSPVNKKTGLPLMSNGKYITEAPAGHGEIVYSGKPDAIHGIREARERGLSKPSENEHAESSKSLLGREMPAGDRRRVTPTGSGPDDEE